MVSIANIQGAEVVASAIDGVEVYHFGLERSASPQTAEAAFFETLSDEDCTWLKKHEVIFYRNPQLADVGASYRTAEIAANSPRYRRRSSTFIDGVHDVPDEKSSPMAPAQLYSTMSGRLFHSGRIVIVLVGPPARGKT